VILPRRFITGLVIAAVLLGSTASAQEYKAQQPARVHRVGFITLNTATGTAGPTLDALRQQLKELGYSEDKNLTIESRFAEGRRELLPVFAQELGTAGVDVVVTFGTPATVAARQAMTRVPIVFVGVGDPVGSGFAASLARPGGNLTGLSFVGPELVAKNLELLKQAIPGASRIAVLGVGMAHPLIPAVWAELERVAPVLRVTLERLDVAPTTAGLEEVFAALRARRPDAVLTLNDPFFFVHRDRILATATELRLPTMFQTIDYVRAGGLLAYVPSLADWGKQAAVYVAKILKGVKPGDLPVEQPTKFELVINLKTAKALGLTIPQTLLLRADQVIE
jgi:putative ABC transport system substrate-binding protein